MAHGLGIGPYAETSDLPDPDLTLAYAVLDRAQATQAQQHGEPLTGPAQRGVLAVVFGHEFAERFPILFTKGH